MLCVLTIVTFFSSNRNAQRTPVDQASLERAVALAFPSLTTESPCDVEYRCVVSYASNPHYEPVLNIEFLCCSRIHVTMQLRSFRVHNDVLEVDDDRLELTAMEIRDVEKEDATSRRRVSYTSRQSHSTLQFSNNAQQIDCLFVLSTLGIQREELEALPVDIDDL